ncbi:MULTISPECIES: tetratricopeptide repeat protein [Pseudomonadota]|jgi:putative thioredoxin|uniref:tetratricopeptide repeat protein n=1 Tax=Pseudomonadota TaxID=1224 RepID=UPI00076A5AD6|nr:MULTISPECIES: tetratricopeptide repeat protein [Pseudomonadota]MAF61627.1 co-chaperone YbbN [Blastomonas sp.]|tara:strand:- start:95766 stop:96671 length:906 start_codon:yes stop_codon:yes gene_type:complete
MGLTTEEHKAVEAFRKNVVEPSMTKLVILDFWAEWCGPCKALTPVLEKVAAQYADRGVVLVKVNVDEERFIASQFQIQSIPTVYAMFQGQPVANLTNARTESQLAGILDQLLDKLPIQAGDGEPQGPDIAPLLDMGEEVLASGDGERAAGIFAQILDMAPDSVAALAGLVRALTLAGKTEEAQALLDDLPPEIASDPLLERAKSALALVADKADDSEIAGLRAAVEANADDHAARYDLAVALFAAGSRDEAADHLLAIVRADKDWNEGAARARLLQIFEAVGLEDPWVSATRRKLSAALFG